MHEWVAPPIAGRNFCRDGVGSYILWKDARSCGRRWVVFSRATSMRLCSMCLCRRGRVSAKEAGAAWASILMGRRACREQLSRVDDFVWGVLPLDMSLELSISARPAEREKLVEIGDVVPIVRTSPCTWEYGRGLTPPRFYGRDTFPSTVSLFPVQLRLGWCETL